MSVSPTVGVRLTVAIAAQKDDVLEPVVSAVAVEVVELHVERLALPVADPALLAAVLFEPLARSRSLR
jgi:hypothetical protein